MSISIWTRLSTVAMFVIVSACGTDKEEALSHEEQQRRRVESFSINGESRILLCQPIDQARRDEFIWVFSEENATTAVLAISEVTADRHSGIEFVRLKIVQTEAELRLIPIENSAASSEDVSPEAESPSIFTVDLKTLRGSVSSKLYAQDLEIVCRR